jgi:hypothetical protein
MNINARIVTSGCHKSNGAKGKDFSKNKRRRRGRMQYIWLLGGQ